MERTAVDNLFNHQWTNTVGSGSGNFQFTTKTRTTKKWPDILQIFQYNQGSENLFIGALKSLHLHLI